MAQAERLTAEELKELPCILVASPEQWETEQTYHQEIVGLRGEFQFVENLEQARLLVMSGKGYLPVEGAPQSHVVFAPRFLDPGGKTHPAELLRFLESGKPEPIR